MGCKAEPQTSTGLGRGGDTARAARVHSLAHLCHGRRARPATERAAGVHLPHSITCVARGSADSSEGCRVKPLEGTLPSVAAVFKQQFYCCTCGANVQSTRVCASVMGQRAGHLGKGKELGPAECLPVRRGLGSCPSRLLGSCLRLACTEPPPQPPAAGAHTTTEPRERGDCSISAPT